MSITCMGTCHSHITPALWCASNHWLRVNDDVLRLDPQRSAGRHGHIQPLRKDKSACWLEQGQQATTPEDRRQHEEGQLRYLECCYHHTEVDVDEVLVHPSYCACVPLVGELQLRCGAGLVCKVLSRWHRRAGPVRRQQHAYFGIGVAADEEVNIWLVIQNLKQPQSWSCWRLVAQIHFSFQFLWNGAVAVC